MNKDTLRKVVEKRIPDSVRDAIKQAVSDESFRCEIRNGVVTLVYGQENLPLSDNFLVLEAVAFFEEWGRQQETEIAQIEEEKAELKAKTKELRRRLGEADTDVD